MAATDIYPMPSGIRGFDGLFSYVVSVEPLVAISLLVVVWVVSFVWVKQYSSSRAWFFASFLCFVLSVPLAILGWLNANFIYLFLLMMLTGFVWIRITESY